jgi:protein tyrosine phosphatase (PTP) superfamily phosphohydrolase (DUF442 family)
MGKLAKILRVLVVVVLLMALGIGGFALYLAAIHNFHSVSERKVYRSAQLNGDLLAETIQKHGIKTVVNLRGGSTNDAWYRGELSTAQRLGVQHLDFDLSAGHEVSDQEMEAIVAAMTSAPKPLLLHCKNGADRSGLASALYLYALENRTAAEADAQLTILCGHFPYLFWRDTAAMDRSYWRYVTNHEANPVAGRKN